MNYQGSKRHLEYLIGKSAPEDLELACLYSGGIDSATAHYYYGGRKYTVVWEGYETKDDEYADRTILITKDMVIKELPNIFKCFDRPVVETGIFPLYFAYKHLAKLGYEHIVTGDGGDELFLGYNWDKLACFKKGIEEHEIINHLYGKHVYIAKSIAKQFGVTIISPFLDLEVVKFVYSLPTSYKCNLFKHKIILYDLMKGKIRLRPKYYFHNPIQEWLGIRRENKAKWFLEKWLETQMTSG